MFTVKLFKGKSIKLLCDKTVDVHAAGPSNPDDPDGKPSSIVMEIVVADQAFYVADVSGGKTFPNFHKDQEFYDMAYIENAGGATTQTVKPY